MSGVQVACLGEVMAEFAPTGAAGDSYRLGFAGDTFNTAVSLARLGVATSYVTLLGDDPFSDRILALMAEEGIASDLVVRLPDQQLGLYVIANTPSGERTFRYWRSSSPARQIWQQPEATARWQQALPTFDCLYLSGITVAIMNPPARVHLWDWLVTYRQNGGKVAFDSNLRLKLWRGLGEAKSAIGDFLRLADYALLTLEDEQTLWGETDAESILRRHRDLVPGEIVIKQGAEPVVLWDGRELHQIPVPAVEQVVDTTGAGDAFNAGFLASRLAGSDVVSAITRGNRAAAAVIQRRGGIVPREYFVAKVGEGGVSYT